MKNIVLFFAIGIPLVTLNEHYPFVGGIAIGWMVSDILWRLAN